MGSVAGSMVVIVGFGVLLWFTCYGSRVWGSILDIAGFGGLLYRALMNYYSGFFIQVYS